MILSPKKKKKNPSIFNNWYLKLLNQSIKTLKKKKKKLVQIQQTQKIIQNNKALMNKKKSLQLQIPNI